MRSAGFPRLWTVETLPVVWQYIILDWLDREVDKTAEVRMPVLQIIYGHRNREVYNFLQADSGRREQELCRKIYGTTNIPANTQWETD